MARQQSLSSLEINKIIDLNNKLEIRQNKKDNPNILPKVTVNDIGTSKVYPKFETRYKWSSKNAYQAGTNGIDYSQKIYPISSPDFDDLRYSTLFADINPM